MILAELAREVTERKGFDERESGLFMCVWRTGGGGQMGLPGCVIESLLAPRWRLNEWDDERRCSMTLKATLSIVARRARTLEQLLIGTEVSSANASPLLDAQETIHMIIAQVFSTIGTVDD